MAGDTNSQHRAFECTEILTETLLHLETESVLTYCKTAGLFDYYKQLKESQKLEEIERYQIVDLVLTNSDVEDRRWKLAGVEITESLIALTLRLEYFPPRAKAFPVLQARLSQIPISYTLFFNAEAVSESETNLPFSSCKTLSIRFVSEFIRNAIWLDSEPCELNFAMVANLVRALRGEKVNWVRLLSFWLQQSIRNVKQASASSGTVKVNWSVIVKLIIQRNFELFVHIPQVVLLRDLVTERNDPIPAMDSENVNKRPRFEVALEEGEDDKQNLKLRRDQLQVPAETAGEDSNYPEPAEDAGTHCIVQNQRDGVNSPEFEFSDGFTQEKVAQRLSAGVAEIAACCKEVFEKYETLKDHWKKLQARIQMKDEQIQCQKKEIEELRKERDARWERLAQVREQIQTLTNDKIQWQKEKMEEEKTRMELARENMKLRAQLEQRQRELDSVKAERDEERSIADNLRADVLKKKKQIAELEMNGALDALNFELSQEGNDFDRTHIEFSQYTQEREMLSVSSQE